MQVLGVMVVQQERQVLDDVTGGRWKTWELGGDAGFQITFADPAWVGGPSAEELEDYLDSVAKSNTSAGKQLQLFCPAWGMLGECDEGHELVHELVCRREWCTEAGCGGKDGKAHQQRKAAWYPRARQMREMGYFVATLPPEVREKYRTKKALGKVGTAFTRMMQRHGFDRGLRRWHFFGEDHSKGDHLYEQLGLPDEEVGSVPSYHPHLNALVEAGWLDGVCPGEVARTGDGCRGPGSCLATIKRSWGHILGVPYDRVNVHYQYASRWHVRKKCHFVSYVLRPTFLYWEWDEELAREIIGFHNCQPWGKWKDRESKEYLEPVWDMSVAETEAPPRELEALVKGFCPLDGSRIIWKVRDGDGYFRVKVVPASRMVRPEWEELAPGYYIRAGPGLPP